MKHIYRFLLIIPIFFSYLNIHSPLMVEAVQSSYENIGTYCEVEEVTSTQLIYFTDNTCYRYSSIINYIEETGRTVYSTSDPSILDETIILFAPGVLNPPVFPFNGDSVNFNFEPSTYYYYIADTDSPKITSIKYLKNNVESLIEILDFMEYQAAKCNLTGSAKNNAIVGSIRAINSDYIGEGYSWVCGNLNTSFMQYINNDYSRHMRSVDFFSYFVESSDFNSSSNGYTIDYDFCTTDKHYLYDPFSSNGIDLIHMFAVIDGNMPNTGRTGMCSLLPMYNKFYDYTVSFMGDIQTGLVNLETIRRNQIDNNMSPTDPNYINCYNFSSFIDFCNNTSDCSVEDILADMDGYSIGKSYIGNLSLDVAFDNYYSLTFSRNMTFRTIVIQNTLNNNPYEYSADEFEECVLDTFGLEYNNNLQSYEYFHNYENYHLIYSHLFENLYIGKTYNPNNLVDVNLLIEILNLFIDYIF